MSSQICLYYPGIDQGRGIQYLQKLNKVICEGNPIFICIVESCLNGLRSSNIGDAGSDAFIALDLRCPQ
jgi:hypothetical protein